MHLKTLKFVLIISTKQLFLLFDKKVQLIKMYIILWLNYKKNFLFKYNFYFYIDVVNYTDWMMNIIDWLIN